MKTLIIYASKYGATREIAKILASKIGSEVQVMDIKDGRPDINSYDAVIIGGSIYMNKIQKSITSFLKANEKKLLEKRLGLFIGCYTPVNTEDYVKQFFSEILLQHAKAIGILGGLMQYDKMNVVYQKLFQSLKKIDNFNKEFKEPRIELEFIDKFIIDFRNG